MKNFFINTVLLSSVIFWSTALFSGRSVAETIAVVVNPKSNIASLSEEEVRKIFLGKLLFYHNKRLFPVDQEDKSLLYQDFCQKVLRKNPSEIKAYWSVKIFTGRGTPPKPVGIDADVKQWVNKNDDSIGYIEQKSVDHTVKVVHLVQE